MNFIIYSTATCPYCRMLKEYLESKNIRYVERLVDQNEDAKAEMERESNGFLGVPFSVVVNDDGSKETILGFDKGKLESLFK